MCHKDGVSCPYFRHYCDSGFTYNEGVVKCVGGSKTTSEKSENSESSPGLPWLAFQWPLPMPLPKLLPEDSDNRQPAAFNLPRILRIVRIFFWSISRYFYLNHPISYSKQRALCV